MIANKIIKMAAVSIMLGLGMLTACSDDNGSTASSFSETNSGKPVAVLDTSLFEKTFSDGKNSCSEDIETDTIHVLAKSASEYEEPYSVMTLEGTWVDGYGRAMCGSFDDIYLYADVKGRALDAAGKPLANALVYTEKNCMPYDSKCQAVTTDAGGYFYLERVNFLSYLEMQVVPVGSNKKVGEAEWEHVPSYNDIPLRIISEDKKYGVNENTDFAKAHMIESDAGVIIDVGDIKLLPAYSVDVPLDSLYFEDYVDGEFVEIPAEEALKNEVFLNIRDVECYYLNYGFNWAPNPRVTMEDVERGYITVDGLPEGTYEVLLYWLDGIAEVYPDTIRVDR
ncbi:MAG: hypothetical protein IKN70_06890 [Fibrobacter sp.]|nr:hypothetical protein [Fibrobacter sp.]MBR4349087.1 hypothetical protein [Fibrobacter sp.]